MFRIRVQTLPRRQPVPSETSVIITTVARCYTRIIQQLMWVLLIINYRPCKTKSALQKVVVLQ